MVNSVRAPGWTVRSPDAAFHAFRMPGGRAGGAAGNVRAEACSRIGRESTQSFSMRTCPECHSDRIHRSRARNTWEAWRKRLTRSLPFRCHSVRLARMDGRRPRLRRPSRERIFFASRFALAASDRVEHGPRRFSIVSTRRPATVTIWGFPRSGSSLCPSASHSISTAFSRTWTVSWFARPNFSSASG